VDSKNTRLIYKDLIYKEPKKDDLKIFAYQKNGSTIQLKKIVLTFTYHLSETF